MKTKSLVAWVAFGAFLAAPLVSALVCAGEIPLDVLPPGNPGEMAFRQALAIEARGGSGAAAAYRSLLGRDDVPQDAVHAALARLLPPDRAAEHWTAVLEIPGSPYAVDALAALAERAEAAGQWERVVQLGRRLEGAARDDDRKAAAAARVMAALDRMGNTREALAAAEHLWVDWAHVPVSREAEPVLARDTGDPFRPVSGERIFQRGKRLLDRGRRDEAIDTLARLRSRLVPGSRIAPRVDLALGKALYFQRRYAEALPVLDRASRSPDTGERARFYRARCLFGLDRGDEGARDLAALARERPGSPRAPLYLYQAYRVFEGRGLWEPAGVARQRLLERYPDAPEARDTRWNTGWQRYRAGDWAGAARAFRASADGADRGWLRARGGYWQARALARAGRIAEAREALAAVVRDQPLGYYARLARSVLAGGDPDLGLADPRTGAPPALPVVPPRAADLGPGDETARAARYLRLGQPEAARRVVDRRRRAGPSWARVAYWAEDYRAAVRASGRSWLDWPGDGAPAPLSPEGLSYPLAYPATATRAAAEAGIHPHLLLAVAHTESHFDPKGYSPWEARGLMQFIPATGRAVAARLGLEGFEPEDLFDPSVALRLGARHLRDLLDRFDGNVVAAVAAYNGGAAAVDRWLAKRADAPVDAFVEAIPYRETRRYVKKVITALDAYARLDPPGLLLPDRPRRSAGPDR